MLAAGLRLVGFALLVFLVSLWSIVFTRGAMGLSSLWIAGGVLCGFLLTTPRARWPAHLAAALAGCLAANVLRNGPTPLTLALSVANVFEAWWVAALVSRRIPDVSQLAHIVRSVRLATAATLLACTVTGAAVSLLRASAPGPDFWPLLLTWVGSHTVGMAIFATLTVAARVERTWLPGAPERRSELFATVLLVVVVCWAVFSQRTFGVGFLVFPPLMLCVFRHHFSGFVPATALVAVIATMQTSVGQGPFMLAGDISDVQRTLMLQVFIASACFLAFPMATVLTGRRLLLHRLATSEAQYRMLAENSRDLVVRLGADGRRLYVSPSASELLGWSPDEFAGPRFDLVHPDDAGALQAALAALFRDGGATTMRFRVRHRDGRWLWLEANASRIDGVGADGGHEVIYSGRDVTARVEAEETLERLARQDPLTGLANRRHYEERLAAALARSARHHTRLALLCLDVDGFKGINDSGGHDVGDAVLREFAQRLRGCLRLEDFAARPGGDEFVVLIEDLDSADAARTVAGKLVAAMRLPFVVGDQVVKVSTSVGVGFAGPGATDGETLKRRADTALYAAKAAGRDGWREAADA